MDMAVLVDAQGDMLDNIESQVNLTNNPLLPSVPPQVQITHTCIFNLLLQWLTNAIKSHRSPQLLTTCKLATLLCRGPKACKRTRGNGCA